MRKLLAFTLLLALAGCGYNEVVVKDEDVKAAWAEVENQYKRRADLVPNLVNTVKGAASFEQETLQKVVEARAKVGQVHVDQSTIDDPQKLHQFEQAQGQLSGALSRLLVVSEQYPQLRATESFRDLQAQLEGTENRIAVERMRFNELSRDFNARRDSFPTVIVAGMFGGRFAEKPYFQAEPEATHAPKVKF